MLVCQYSGASLQGTIFKLETSPLSPVGGSPEVLSLHYGKGDSLVLSSEVTNVLSRWERGFPCPFFRGRPLLRGNKCTITMRKGFPCPFFRGCPLLIGNKCTITMGKGFPCMSFLQRLSAVRFHWNAMVTELR